MKLGIDHLLGEPSLLERLKGRRVGLVAHPASLTQDLTHSLDALMAAGIEPTIAFGPQHGLRGDKQDNMVESANFTDARGVPVVSLYGEHRRPTDDMMGEIDVLLFDLQDLGCRIYTFLTTLHYMIEACSRLGKSLWVLDRPNPAGRPIEGLRLRPGQESFVGCDELVMRHGLTLGEFARWVVAKHELDLDMEVIAMDAYDPTSGPGFGWPGATRPWINPSPNAASLNMARCYPGTVLLEGTTLSEGRGTTHPLEVAGAPGLDISAILKQMHDVAPDWMQGAVLRPCYFEPTFHKHVGTLCAGIQIHTDLPAYQHDVFKPYRLIMLFLKSLRLLDADYPLWSDQEYEYESIRRPIDVINGGPELRLWVDDTEAQAGDLEGRLYNDENRWSRAVQPFFLYD